MPSSVKATASRPSIFFSSSVAASGAEASFSVHVVTELPQSQGADSASVETDVDAAQ